MSSARKLGLLISASPAEANFQRGLALAKAALAAKVDVYFYLIDRAAAGAREALVHELVDGGARGFACAYSARKLGVALEGPCIFSGLTLLSDIIGSTDRFVVFN